MAVVLVADDDADSRCLARVVLALDGFVVVEAADGEEAWRQARAARPDVAVFDVRMPGCGGVELARRIRADPSLRTRVVLASALGLDADVRAGLAAGVDSYLVKPYSVAQLRAAVRMALRHDAA